MSRWRRGEIPVESERITIEIKEAEMINMGALKKTILEAVSELKKEMPNLNHVTFEVSEWYKGKVHGFYHIGNECESYKDIEDLAVLLSDRKKARAENEILFRKFN